MPKTKLTLLLLAALLVGVCIGFFTNSAIIRARIAAFSQIPENMPERITQKLRTAWNWMPRSSEQVLAVFQAYETRMEETREQRRAMIDALIEEVRVEISQYLTPEQQEEHKKMLAEMSQRRRDNRALRRAYPNAVSTNSGKK